MLAKLKRSLLLMTMTLLVMLWNILFAQGNGNNLAFQGLYDETENGVKALAMGGAYIAHSGDINSIYYNPAGLADIDKFQLSFSYANKGYLTHEYQRWTNHRGVNGAVELLLRGNYNFDPQYNWVRSDSIIYEEDRWLGPKTGVGYYEKDDADWVYDNNRNGLNFVVGFPFKVGSTKISLAGAYVDKNNIIDYDRNDTYLTPQTNLYSVQIKLPDGRTSVVPFEWFQYERERTGELKSIMGAASIKLNNNLSFGVCVNTISGDTEDRLGLDKVGDVSLDPPIELSAYRFKYDTLNTSIEGTSKFSGTKFDLGTLISFDHISFGARVSLPSTIERSYKYVVTQSTANGSSSQDSTGVDKLGLPVTYGFGLNIRPVNRLALAFDLQMNPYSHNEWETAGCDTNANEWVDQTILRFGIEYKLTDYMSLLGGYRQIPLAFASQGQEFKDSGEIGESITVGVNIKILSGWLDIAYESRDTKYVDWYGWNRNYVRQRQNTFLVGYTLVL